MLLFPRRAACELSCRQRVLCPSCRSPKSNKLYVDLSEEVEPGGFLFMDDEIPHVPDWKRPKIFYPLKHGFNPLKEIDYRKA